MKPIWTRLWAANMRRGLAMLYKASKPAKKQAIQRTSKRDGKNAKSINANKGRWLTGIAINAHGVRRYRLFCPEGIQVGERVPLLVMLHGCGQDAQDFAASTRMNQVAMRERFIVLYPEQDRLANPQGCWNWFDTRSGRAYGEVALIMNAIDQVCWLYPVDRQRIAMAGLSAGASMAALAATRHPDRFKAIVMHSGVPPGAAHSTFTALGAMHGHRAATVQATPSTPNEMLPPLLVIHGAADKLVVARNGHAAAQLWADAAGARATQARLVQRGKRYAMNVTDFRHRGRTVATLAEVDKLGHAWSGGAAKASISDPKGPDASRMVWAFAVKQFRK